MSRKILLVVQLITLICCVLSKSVDLNNNNEPIVNLLNQGRLKGSVSQTVWTKQNYMQFLGIPYAESPTKNLRFKAPVPKEKWYDIRDATEYGRRCPTLEFVKSLNAEQLKEDLEDCLSLSVYTKDLKAKRPVIFYIHGGGFIDGGSYKIPGGYFMEKDIVMVVPQYRLGHFGFLSTKTEGMPGNMAVLDIVLSLKWLRENIEYFGGDPYDITIAGESAGSMLLNALLISPGVPKGLFNRGIMSSGSIFSPLSLSKDYMEVTRNVCNQICPRTCRTKTEINQCFMDVPVKRILEAEGISKITIDDYYGIIPEAPEILAKKTTNKLPLMASTNKHDGSAWFAEMYFNLKVKEMPAIDFAKMFLSTYGDKNMSQDEIKSLIDYVLTPEQQNEKDFMKVLPNLVDLSSIVTMKKPTLDFIKMNSMNTSYNNYISTFDYLGERTKFRAPVLLDKYPFKNGVHHADDLFLLFNTHQLNERDTEASKLLIEIWTSFAITGQPSVRNGPTIMPVTAESSPYFHFNSEVTTGDDFENEYLISVYESPEK